MITLELLCSILKALDSYRQCCETAVQLRKVFSTSDMAKMREALIDY